MSTINCKMVIKRAAGFLIFRRLNEQIEYLLLRASYGSKHWTPPKGQFYWIHSIWKSLIDNFQVMSIQVRMIIRQRWEKRKKRPVMVKEISSFTKINKKFWNTKSAKTIKLWFIGLLNFVMQIKIQFSLKNTPNFVGWTRLTPNISADLKVLVKWSIIFTIN